MAMRRIILTALVLAAIGLCWWLRGGPEPLSLRYELEPGMRSTYALHYEGTEQVALPQLDGAGASALEVHTEIDAEVVITVLARRDDRWILRWQLHRLHEAVLTMNGHSVVPDRAAAVELLEGKDAIVELGIRGDVVGVHVDPQDSELFQNVAKLVIAETQVELAEVPAIEWTAREDGALGKVATTTAIVGEEAGTVALDKRRGRYSRFLALPWHDDHEALTQRLEHRASVGFRGRVVQLEADEDLEVSDGDRTVLAARSKLTWSLVATDVDAGAMADEVTDLLARRRAFTLAEVPPSPAAEENALRQQAGDLSWQAIADRLRGFAASDLNTAAHDAFVWQAVGLLELQPELCDGFVALFAEPGVTPEGRYLALDLLAATGHGTAQRVMRQVLGTRAATDDDGVYARLVQRLGRVERPDAETAAFALGAYDAATREHDRIATSLTLGSVIRKLPPGSVEQSALYRRLLDDLRRASSPESEVRLLRALSNAGQDENFAVAARYVDVESAEVRAAAALAVAKVARPEAADLLVELAGDANAQVQTTALRALGDRELDDELVDGLTAQIRSGRVDGRSYWAAYDLVRRMPDSHDREELARYMAAHAPADPRLRSKLLALAAG